MTWNDDEKNLTWSATGAGHGSGTDQPTPPPANEEDAPPPEEEEDEEK
jgi:hypothetical protein